MYIFECHLIKMSMLACHPLLNSTQHKVQLGLMDVTSSVILSKMKVRQRGAYAYQ